MIEEAERRLTDIYDRAIGARGLDHLTLETELLNELSKVHPVPRADAVWFRHLVLEGATLEAAIEFTRLVNPTWEGHVSFGNDGARLAMVGHSTETAASPALAVIASLSKNMHAMAHRRIST